MSTTIAKPKKHIFIHDSVGFSQEQRLVQLLVSYFEYNAFGVSRAHFKESLSSPYCYQVDLFSDQYHDLNASDVIGIECSLMVAQDAGKDPRLFNGYITSLTHLGRASETRRTHYQITVEPWLQLYSSANDCRIFQNVSVVGVLKQLFKNIPIAKVNFDGLTEEHPTRDYWVQYNESVVNFFHRLCQLEGIAYYYHQEPGAHTLCLVDNANALPNLTEPNPLLLQPNTLDHRHLTNWWMDKHFIVGKTRQSTYNYQQPREKPRPLASVTGEAEQTPMVNRIESYADSEIFDHYQDGEQETKRLNRRHTVNYGRWYGQGDYLHLAAGHHFTVDRIQNAAAFQDKNQRFTLIHTDLLVDQSSHLISSSFEAVTQGELVTPVGIKQKMMGLQTAFVTGDSAKGTPFIDPEGLGRVKVQFHWDREGRYDGNTTCWMRVMSTLAGPDFGLQCTPRVGQEVVVAFENGNPDKPFIIGTLYHGEHAPPFSGDEGYRSGLRTRSVDPGESQEILKGFNELSFFDKRGQEQVYLRAEKDMVEDVLGSRATSVGISEQHHVGKDLSISADNSISLRVGNNVIQMTHDGITINGKIVDINNT